MAERESDPPGAVSNQNQEEAESGMREDASHPEPRTSGGGDESKGADHDSSGESGEGSQSTGHPDNAG
jgi:hypothetical protein